MRRICWIVLVLFSLLYALAIALLIVGTFGLFGADRDPLSGVLLVPLGLPWNLLVDALPEPAWPWLAAAAPSVNLLLLWLLCRWRSFRR
jgi:hypothetical protein